jgi:hypothetical protein
VTGIDPHSDPTLQQLEVQIRSRLIVGEPVVQWVAPFTGRVVLTGRARKPNAGGDGVVLEAFHNDEQITGLFIAQDTTNEVNFVDTPWSTESLMMRSFIAS